MTLPIGTGECEMRQNFAPSHRRRDPLEIIEVPRLG